jgi:predicted transcriptional regulator
MDAHIPTTEEVRAQLGKLTHGAVSALAVRSGVPFTTLWKIRSGETKNPGLETVRQFGPHIATDAAPAGQEVGHG